MSMLVLQLLETRDVPQVVATILVLREGEVQIPQHACPPMSWKRIEDPELLPDLGRVATPLPLRLQLLPRNRLPPRQLLETVTSGFVLGVIKQML